MEMKTSPKERHLGNLLFSFFLNIKGSTDPAKRSARSVHGTYSGIADVAVGLGEFESVGVAVGVAVCISELSDPFWLMLLLDTIECAPCVDIGVNMLPTLFVVVSLTNVLLFAIMSLSQILL